MLNRLLSVLFFLLLGGQIWGQYYFELGYFVDNSGNKKLCYIKNLKWKENPTEIEYRRKETDPSSFAKIAEVSEFSIIGQSKYVRANVEIDRAADSVLGPKAKRKHKLTTEQLLLKQISEGEACLYSFEEAKLKLYFYTVSASKIKQMTSGRDYSIPVQLTSGELANQLRKDVWYAQMGENELVNVKYDETSLSAYFKAFNTFHKENLSSSEFSNFKLVAGTNISSFSISTPDYQSSNKTLNFSTTLNYKLGFEGEFFFPFDRNKWSLIFAPTFQRYTFKVNDDINYSWARISKQNKTHYSMFEAPVGVRYRVYLYNHMSMFVNGLCAIHFSPSTDIETGQSSYIELNRNGIRLAGGLGFEYNKFCAEYRYYAKYNLIDSYTSMSSEFANHSLIFSYRIFRKDYAPAPSLPVLGE